MKKLLFILTLLFLIQCQTETKKYTIQLDYIDGVSTISQFNLPENTNVRIISNGYTYYVYFDSPYTNSNGPTGVIRAKVLKIE